MTATNVPRRPVLLIIMDGVGLNPSKQNNALAQAHTPNLDRIFSSTPTTVIEASGAAVGLPSGQMGNSEVGHLTIGAGQVLKQDLVRIDDSIDSGDFFQLAALQNALQQAKDAGRPLHLIGLVSDGGVHSHLRHVLALIRACAQAGVKPQLHCICDGRDTAPQSAKRFLDTVMPELHAAGGWVGSVSGRYYALDRDHRWERVQQAFNAIALGQGDACADALQAIEASYADGEHDEFIRPRVLSAHQAMQAGDSGIFFNFRNDRPRELAQALVQADFPHFARGDFQPLTLTTFTDYDPALDVPVLFPKENLRVTLGSTLAAHGIAQFHCAETEKYPHVTYFFNGGQEAACEGEERALIPSPKVATYDLQPEMSAEAISEAVREALQSRQYGFVVVNYANGDMVGHTGVPEAVIKAVEVVDTEVGRLWQWAQEMGYSIILSADHGNCDMLVDPVTGAPHTQHTCFPVPCAILDDTPRTLATGGGLSNLAATVLELMGVPVPPEMARSLLLD